MDIPGNGGRVDIDMDDFRVGSEGMELSGDPVVKAGTDGKDVLSPDPRPYGRGDFMSTYEEFMVIIAIASLIVSILNLTHKK